MLIETAIGMVNVDEIATACPERMEAMIFGVADYAASIQSHTASIGGVDPNYAVLTDSDGHADERERHWGDQWHYPLARIAVTCRAHGLRPIDGPFGDFTDPEGYVAAARRSAVLGYEGKWAIHPAQIELANEVFTPAPRLVERTRRIIEAMSEAAAEGRGAVSLDGRLIDAASIRMAENLLAKLEQIEARELEQAEPPSPGAACARSPSVPKPTRARAASSAATNSSLPSMYASRSSGWRRDEPALQGLVAAQPPRGARAGSPAPRRGGARARCPASQTCRW